MDRAAALAKLVEDIHNTKRGADVLREGGVDAQVAGHLAECSRALGDALIAASWAAGSVNR